jgi:hypothetical protein
VAANSAAVVERVLDVLLGEDEGVTQQQAQPAIRAQGNGNLRQEPVAITLPCATGQVSFDGEVTRGTGGSFTVEGATRFANCEGIAGVLDLDSAGTIGNQIAITVTLNGPVTAEGYAITFDSTTAETTATQTGVITAPIIVNGTVRGTCDSESVVCTLEDVDLDDREAFEGSCQSM